MNYLNKKVLLSSLLLASTATPSLAQTTVSTAVTATQATSGTTAGLIVDGTGSITVTGNAISIDSGIDTLSVGAAENSITIQTGGVITGTTNGILAAGDASATVINNAGTINGGSNSAIDLSAMTTNGSTLTNSGTISGTVTLSGQADTITLNGGTINGAFDGGAGTDALTVTGDFTTGGTFTGVEGFTVSNSSTLAIGHTVTGAATVNVNGDSTLDLNTDLTLSGALTQAADSTVSVNAGSTLTAASYSPTSGAIYNVGVSGTTTGLLTLSGAAVDFTNVSVTVTTEAAVADGTSLTIATGNAGATIGGQVSETSFLYDYTLLVDGNNVDMTVSRTSLATVATSDETAGAAATLEALGTSGNTELDAIQTSLGNATTAAAVQDILESVTPAVGGATTAAMDATAGVTGNVDSRMAEARSAQRGMAAGDMMAEGHMWVKAYGQSAEQDTLDNKDGYDASSYGISFGADRADLVEDAVVGLAFSYGDANVDSDAGNSAETDANTYQLTLYGNRDLGNGLYMDGQVGVGYNEYETTRSVGGNTAKGDFDGMQYTAKVGVGKVVEQDGWTLNPFGSLQYAFAKTDEYTETGAGGANLTVDTADYDTLTLAVGAKASYDMMSGDTLFRPNAAATVLYNVKHDTAEATSNFVGGGTSFETTGLETSRTGLRLGTGLDIISNGGVEFNVNYDADIRDEYLSHTGTVNLRWQF